MNSKGKLLVRFGGIVVDDKLSGLDDMYIMDIGMIIITSIKVIIIALYDFYT